MNKVHLIDCMEFMKGIPDKYYELAIVDPPYNVGASDGKFGGKLKSPSRVTTANGKHYANHDKTPQKEYFEELFRISNNQIIWGANYYPQYLYHSGWVVWDKLTTGPLSDCELAFQSINKLVEKYTSAWTGYNKGNKEERESERIHPNQKPICLYRWLLKNYAKPNDKIFDSHVGSGSIRIACHDMGFSFEGCEIDKDYWEAQEKRYKTHVSQQDLFTPEVMQDTIYQKELL